MILSNVDRADDYGEKATFRECLDNFKAFSQLLEVNINFLDTHPNEIDMRKLI